MNTELALVAQENPVPEGEVAGLVRSPQARAVYASIVVTERPAHRRRLSQRALVLVAAVLVVCGGTAVGAKIALTGSEVQEFLPRGSAIFIGTNPTCVDLRPGIEFECTLASVPTQEQAFASDGSLDFKGWVDDIVDSNHKVAGGCRAETKDGLHWRCYLGEEAVKQQIIAQGFLGQTQLQPGHG
jgi:hypothetical protein